MLLLFDLDGTLVDSAAGVLASLEAALSTCDVAPRLPLDRRWIGPPLGACLEMLAGSVDPSVLDKLSRAFRQHYDSEGYLATVPYAGVPETLERLAVGGHLLVVVTNKRLAPTRLILRRLGLDRHLAEIHAIDEVEPPWPSKTVLVARLLDRHATSSQDALLVGDTEEDGRAAFANGVRFVFAGYGYGTLEDPTVPFSSRIERFTDLTLEAGLLAPTDSTAQAPDRGLP